MTAQARPKCPCGQEMQVIEYRGFYETFNFWAFSEKCKCTKNIRVRDFEPDKVIRGSYAR